jgi:hypothetical protein
MNTMNEYYFKFFYTVLLGLERLNEHKRDL